MNHLKGLTEWVDSVVGEYDSPTTEGYDAMNPVTGSISKDEIARFRANQPINGKTATKSKKHGPSPEIREKLKQLRAEFAAKANIKEADQPANGSIFSPLSSVTRENPKVDSRIEAKKRKEERRLSKFMGR